MIKHLVVILLSLIPVIKRKLLTSGEEDKEILKKLPDPTFGANVGWDEIILYFYQLKSIVKEIKSKREERELFSDEDDTAMDFISKYISSNKTEIDADITLFVAGLGLPPVAKQLVQEKIREFVFSLIEDYQE